MKKVLAIVLGITVSTSVLGQPAPEYLHIDFSHFPDGVATTENLQISDQYAAYGVYFSMDDGPGSPIVVKVGDPAVAYLSGTNDYICFGSSGLTDPIGTGGDITAFRPIRIDFDPPVRLFRFSSGRSSVGQFPAVSFYYGDSEGQVVPSACTGPQGGCRRYEGVSSNTPGSPLITHVAIANPTPGQPLGYTISALTLIRDPQPIAGPFVRVAQESAPGQGDFEENILGMLRPWRAPGGTAPHISDVYPYGTINWNDVSYDGPPEAFRLEIDGTRFGFIEAAEGLSLVVIHDNPTQQCPVGRTNGGGHAEMSLLFEGNTSQLSNIVRDDDGGDTYVLDANNMTFTAVSDWISPNTDGFTISGFSGDWSVIISFTELDNDLTTPPIQNLTSWAAQTTDGLPINLNLEEDLRVQLKAICLADVNGNCRVDLTDFASFTACMHGPGVTVSEVCERFDVEQGPPDHDVDLRDFARFEAAFNGF